MADQPVALDEAMIENVVRTFYGRAQKDALLGPIFDSAVHDWEKHIKNICDFWSAVMLQTRRYQGRPMPQHVVLPIDQQHFDRWLELFNETVRDLCIPYDAELFMKKANQIAHSLELGLAHKHGVMLGLGERFHLPQKGE